MKRLAIIMFAAVLYSACTTKETKETTIETVEVPVMVPADEPTPPPATTPAPEKKDNKFELELSDTGSSMKIKVP